MFLCPFIITLAMSSITSSPIITTTTTITKTSSTTITIASSSKTTETITTSTLITTGEAFSSLDITTEASSLNSATLITKTTTMFVTTATVLTTSNEQPPHNRSCLNNLAWLCDTLKDCLWLPLVCNGFPDCPDGSDEAAGCSEDPRYCPFEAGTPGWRCDSGECIRKGEDCNSISDCKDGSDERSGCANMDFVICPTNNNTLTERWAMTNDNCRLCRDVNNWRCDNGQCTKRNRVCDGRLGDCLDGSDEWEGCDSNNNSRSCLTEEGSTGWLCNDKVTCIWLPNVCDGFGPDCPDGSDEADGCSEDPRYCFFENGAPGWRCDSGECYHKDGICNNIPDCRDGSDERAGCETMDLVPCPTDNNTLTERWSANVDCRMCRDVNNWRCDDGRCTRKWWVCDGHPGDCLDDSDEWEDCKSVYTDRFPPNNNNRSCLHKGKHTGWLCDDKTTCIWLAHVCDGTIKLGCPDGSDETSGCSEYLRYCPYKNKISGWRCDSGDCIDKRSVCDSNPQCKDGSDEMIGCEELDLVPCPIQNSTLTERWAANDNCRKCLAYGMWRCDNGHCVLNNLVCDGRPNCLDGSDEREGCKSVYSHILPSKENIRSCVDPNGKPGWLCDDRTTCIWKRHVCDGSFHCLDNSDEIVGCSDDPRYCTFETGEPGWRCDSGDCINKARVCEGQPECRDGSDEKVGCTAMDLVPCPTNNTTLTEKWTANDDCRKCWDHINSWRCDNGRCTKKSGMCNGIVDCLDGSDEWEGCDLVTCLNDSSIITAAKFADGDCRRCEKELYWRCNDGYCIDKYRLCDGIQNCPSGEDEIIGCSSLVPCLYNGIRVMTEPKYKESGQCRSCFDDYWRCNSGQCVAKSTVCDNVMFGSWDCYDGSDEEPGSGCPANITCIADKSIITTPYFSNGLLEQCLSCSGDFKGKPATNYKRCKNGQCKHKVLFCNSYPDCFDGSDEFDCNIFAYFDTTKAFMLSFGLVALTAYLYIKFTNFHSFNLTSAPKKYPKKTPQLYKNIQKYCSMLESDIDNNEEKFKKIHISIRNKRNGLRQLIIAITSIYEEPQLCHKYCNKVLNEETQFHENRSQSLMYIRMSAGSNIYTEKFANAIESPGFISKLSFSFTYRLNYVSLKMGHFMRLIKALAKMVLFYLDVIKDVALFFKLWHIVSQLEDVNILQHLLVYISCILVFSAQSIIGLYLAVQLGKPHRKLPPSLFALVLFLLFLISPLIPIVLVVKDSLLISDIEEKKREMKNNKNKKKGLTKFLTFVSLANKEAAETKRLFSFYKIVDSVLESFPQLVIYSIYCMTYYYGNSLVPILFNNTNTFNTILFACSIPLSLFSVVSGVNSYSSVDGKSHYTKQISYFFQITSRVSAILSFISPLYALYFTKFKVMYEKTQISYPNYSWIPDFLTTSLISITYPRIVSLLIMLTVILAFHGMFIYFYSQKNIPGFVDSPFFHKLTHTLGNTFIVLPWRPLGQEEQRKRSQEHQNFHIAMAVSNIFIIISSSILREYTSVDVVFPGHETRQQLDWLYHYVYKQSPSTIYLLDKLYPYHYPIGLLLNVLAHIPWLLLVLVLQGIGIITMSLYYKKFHPWRAIINNTDINKTTIVQEVFTTRNEALEEESEIEWVDEDEMEDDTDENDDDIITVEHKEKDGSKTAQDYLNVNLQKDKEKQDLEENIHQHNSSIYKLEQDRSHLKKCLDMQRKKRENYRKDYFSDMIRTNSSNENASNNLFFTRTNKLKIQVDIHESEVKKKHEAGDSKSHHEPQEVIGHKNAQAQDWAMLPERVVSSEDNANVTGNVEPAEETQFSNKTFCREILLELIDKTLTSEDDSHIEDFLKEVETENQCFCKKIILELVGDVVDATYY